MTRGRVGRTFVIRERVTFRVALQLRKIMRHTTPRYHFAEDVCHVAGIDAAGVGHVVLAPLVDVHATH